MTINFIFENNSFLTFFDFAFLQHIGMSFLSWLRSCISFNTGYRKTHSNVKPVFIYFRTVANFSYKPAVRTICCCGNIDGSVHLFSAKWWYTNLMARGTLKCHGTGTKWFGRVLGEVVTRYRERPTWHTSARYDSQAAQQALPTQRRRNIHTNTDFQYHSYCLWRSFAFQDVQLRALE